MNATKHYDAPVLTSHGDITERTENDLVVTSNAEPIALRWYKTGEL